MSSWHRAALFALSALIVASCAAGWTLRTMTYGPHEAGTARLFAAWAGSGGPILVELRNNPYPNPPQQVAQIIAEAASGYVLVGVTFTANRSAAWHPDWRVVYAY